VQYGTSADELVTAAYLDNRWRETLIESWSKAALLHSNAEWAISLWDRGCQRQRGNATWGIHTSLLITMPRQEAEHRVLNILTDLKHPDQKDWEDALAFLPRPWSKTFGEAYLGQLREYISTLKFDKKGSPHYDSWYQSLAIATLALPPACFAQAIERFVIPDTSDTHTQWQQALKKFVEAIRIRQRIVKEIAL
jgi:hypothetical protein